MEHIRSMFLTSLLVLTVWYRCCDSSSIYVGRHASGSRPRLTDTYEDCKDFNPPKCQKIISWVGHQACKDQSTAYARTLSRICPKSCGLCGCKDAGMFCATVSSLCDNNDETGKFLQHNCPKTCKTCQGVNEEEPEFAALL